MRFNIQRIIVCILYVENCHMDTGKGFNDSVLIFENFFVNIIYVNMIHHVFFFLLYILSLEKNELRF